MPNYDGKKGAEGLVVTRRTAVGVVHSGGAVPLGLHMVIDAAGAFSVRLMLSSVEPMYGLDHVLVGKVNPDPDHGRLVRRIGSAGAFPARPHQFVHPFTPPAFCIPISAARRGTGSVDRGETHEAVPVRSSSSQWESEPAHCRGRVACPRRHRRFHTVLLRTQIGAECAGCCL